MRKFKVELPKGFEEYGQLEDTLEQGNFFAVAMSNAMQKKLDIIKIVAIAVVGCD